MTEYGASRTVTREAVSRLQTLGLLEGRKRKGLIVHRPDPLRLFQNSLPSLMTSPDDWRDLTLLRYAIEVGGGVKQGLVHGLTDAIGAYPTSHPVSPADFVATIYQLMGIDPHQTVPDRTGRPNPIAHGGDPVREIIA